MATQHIAYHSRCDPHFSALPWPLAKAPLPHPFMCNHNPNRLDGLGRPGPAQRSAVHNSVLASPAHCSALTSMAKGTCQLTGS